MRDTQDAASALSVPGALKLEMGDQNWKGTRSLREGVLLTGKGAAVLKVVSQSVPVCVWGGNLRMYEEFSVAL